MIVVVNDRLLRCSTCKKLWRHTAPIPIDEAQRLLSEAHECGPTRVVMSDTPLERYGCRYPAYALIGLLLLAVLAGIVGIL